MNMGDVLIVGTAEYTQLDRLKAKLEEWAIWRESYRPNLGYSKPRFYGGAGIHDYDYETTNSKLDRTNMYIIETVIDDMRKPKPGWHSAIECCYLGAPYRFARDNYDELLQGAHEWLLIKIPARGVVL